MLKSDYKKIVYRNFMNFGFNSKESNEMASLIDIKYNINNQIDPEKAAIDFFKIKLKEQIFDILFKKSSTCSFCGKRDCGHSNRTLTYNIHRDVIIDALNIVLGD